MKSLDFSSSTVLRTLVAVAAIGLVIFLVTFASYFLVRVGYDFSTDNTVWGQFGDFVGGVLNPVFAFLAFVGLLATIALQARELEEARASAAKAADLAAEQTHIMFRQSQAQSRERKLADLDKALRLQSDLIESDLDRDVFRFISPNQTTTHSFRIGIERAASALRRGESDSRYNFQTDKTSHHAGAIVARLARLVRLLEVYDGLQSVDTERATSWFYTNTWREAYFDLALDLRKLGFGDDILLVDKLTPRDPPPGS